MPPPNAAGCNAMGVGRTSASAGSRIRAARSAGSLVMTRPGPDGGQCVPLSLACRRRPLLPGWSVRNVGGGRDHCSENGIAEAMEQFIFSLPVTLTQVPSHLIRDLPAPVTSIGPDS